MSARQVSVLLPSAARLRIKVFHTVTGASTPTTLPSSINNSLAL